MVGAITGVISVIARASSDLQRALAAAIWSRRWRACWMCAATQQRPHAPASRPNW